MISLRKIYAAAAALGSGEKGRIDCGLAIIDTMKDLFVNFIGALVFSVTGFFYARSRGRRKASF